MTEQTPAGSPDQTVDASTMRAVIDNLDQGISVFDRDLRLVLWNRRFVELFGYPAGFIHHGQAFADIIRFNVERNEYGPCEAESYIRQRCEDLATFQPQRREHTRPDGTVIEVIGNPLPGGGFVSTFSDVTVARQVAGNLRHSTERLDKMVERRTRALQDSEDRYRAYSEMLEATVRHMPQGVCVFDSDLRLVVANAGFFELCQIPETFNVPGKPFEDFTLFSAQRGEYGPGNPVDLARERVELARHMESHAFDRTRPDGVVIEVRGNPIPGRGFVNTITDITARHQAEESLREAATMARTMLNAPGLLVLLVTLDGTLIDLNDEAATSLGGTKQGLIGTNVLRRMSSEVAHRRAAYAQQAIEESRAVHFEDEREGSWFETTMTPYPSDGSALPRVMVIAHDVTHRHQAEDRLRMAMVMAETANRTKNDFLAAMSHELRTPLNAILGFSEIIGREMFGPIGERYAAYGRDIHSAGQHLLAMINDILDISRIEIGAFSLSRESADPAAMAESSMRLVGTRAEQSSVRLRTELPADLPALHVDVRRTKQILINLLGNAVKFTPPGGTVTLRAAVTGDGGFEFVVMDTGIGMTAADIEVALSPFGQVDSGLDRRFEGAGLGLPLAKSLAELHGGALTVESKPGEGTTITVRFPPDCVVTASEEVQE